MFYTYILKSLKDDRTYVGYTNDINDRLRRHNCGEVTSTKHRRPLELIFLETFQTEKEAKGKEKYWKNGGGRRRLKQFFK